MRTTTMNWMRMGIVGLAMLGGGATAHAEDRPTCAVTTFDAREGMTAGEVKLLCDIFAAELNKLGAFTLIPREQMKDLLSVEEYNRACGDSFCAIEVGKSLNIQQVVFGSMGKLGSTYSVTVSLADVETKEIVKSIPHYHRGEIDDLMSYGMAAAARKLAGVNPMAASATGGASRAAPGPMGAQFDDIASILREKEAEAKRIEEERKAAEKRLAEELARRKAQFEKQYATYLEIAQSRHADDAMKRDAWRRIAEGWGVKNPGTDPAGLAWDDRTGLLKVVPLGGAGGGRPGETTTVDLGNGVTMEMVWVEPGTFTMGSPDSEDGRDSDESPQHQVTISKGFWMGKYEVTQRQWEQVMGSNPSNFKGGNNPVEQVSWNDCQAFIEKLNGRRKTEDGRFRLPTEAEWEYACRAGTTGALNSGKPLTSTEGRCRNLDELGWYDQNSGSQTHPVGQKQPNAWGLYDMHGNVWEWCEDWYGGYEGRSVPDPTGPGSGSRRVGRGGSWGYGARDCRSAIRGRDGPGLRGNNLGFRLVRTAP